MTSITRFLDACCLLAPNARCPAIELYLTYVYWCLKKGLPVQDQFTFADLLECMGLKYREKKKRSWFRGVAVLPRFRLDNVTESPG